jgi:hypothetical protein
MTGDGSLLHIDLTTDDDSGERREGEREDGDAAVPLCGAGEENEAGMSAVLVTQERREVERKDGVLTEGEKDKDIEEIDQRSGGEGCPPRVQEPGDTSKYSDVNERLRRDGLEPMDEAEEFACSVLRAGAGAAAGGVGGVGDGRTGGLGGVGDAHGGGRRQEAQDFGGAPACVPLKLVEDSTVQRSGFSFLSDHNKRQKTLLVCVLLFGFFCLFLLTVYVYYPTVYVYTRLRHYLCEYYIIYTTLTRAKHALNDACSEPYSSTKGIRYSPPAGTDNHTITFPLISIGWK